VTPFTKEPACQRKARRGGEIDAEDISKSIATGLLRALPRRTAK